MHALEVVAGHRLVDREESEHPVVILAEVALDLLGRPVLGDRCDAEERFLGLVERARRVEHRSAERPQEYGRPHDLERFVGHAEDVPLAAERLDPPELRAAEVEEVLRLLVLSGDRVEDRPDGLGLGGRLAPGRCGRRQRPIRFPDRPRLAREADHLGPNRGVLALGALEHLVRRQVDAERVAKLGREEIRPEAALALSRRNDRVAEVVAEARQGRPGRFRRSVETRQEGRHLGIGACGVVRRGLTRRHRLPYELLDPGQLLERRLRMEPRDRPVAVADDLRPRRVEQRRQPLHAPGRAREPSREGGELPGEQREETAAHEVHPVQRVPAILAELLLAEPGGVELEEENVPVGELVAREHGHVEAAQLGDPAIGERKPTGPAGVGHVRPAIVEPVVADAAGTYRIQAEVLVEERGDAVRKGVGCGGHGGLPAGGRSPCGVARWVG